VSDLVYVLITVVSFAGLALLVGLLDRRIAEPEEQEPNEQAALERDLTAVGR